MGKNKESMLIPDDQTLIKKDEASQQGSDAFEAGAQSLLERLNQKYAQQDSRKQDAQVNGKIELYRKLFSGVNKS